MSSTVSVSLSWRKKREVSFYHVINESFYFFVLKWFFQSIPSKFFPKYFAFTLYSRLENKGGKKNVTLKGNVFPCSNFAEGEVTLV